MGGGGEGKGDQHHDKMAAILPELYTKYRANLQAHFILLNTLDPHNTHIYKPKLRLKPYTWPGSSQETDQKWKYRLDIASIYKGALSAKVTLCNLFKEGIHFFPKFTEWCPNKKRGTWLELNFCIWFGFGHPSIEPQLLASWDNPPIYVQKTDNYMQIFTVKMTTSAYKVIYIQY